MSTSLDTDSSMSTELVDLRRQVFELQQALTHATHSCASAPISAPNAAPVGTWEWKGSINRIIWSPQTERIFGFLPGSFDGTYQGYFTLVHPDDRLKLRLAIARAIEDRTSYRIEHRIISPDGTVRWVECHGYTLLRNNEPRTSMIGTIEDITVRKELELARPDLRDTVEAQVREYTAELEQTITDLKREVARRQLTESALKEREQHYQSLYEHAGVGIAQLSLDGRFLRVNPRFCETLGYSSKTMLLSNFQEFTHPDDLTGSLDYLAELLTGKRHSFSLEKRFRRHDGNWVWVNLTVSLVCTTSGDPSYLIAVAQHIDDHKRSYSLLQAAINSVADGLLVINRQGKITSVNQRFLQLWKIPQALADSGDDEALLTFVIDQLQAPEAFLRKVRKLYAQPDQESFDVLEFKDGRVFERYARPQILGGEIVGRVWSFRDITEHRRAAEALRASELRLQRFVANAPVGLVILDESWRVVSANKALCQLTGYDEHEIVGSTYALYTHPQDLAANIVLTDEFFRGIRSEYTCEKRYIRKSGEVIWVSVKATRVELSGHAGPLLLAAIQDITERKLATEEREHLSRDLHDNILQDLYAVGMQLEAGKLSLGKSPRRSKVHMTQAIHQLNTLMLDVRRFIALLTQRTTVEPDFGQALRQLITSMSGAGQSTPELDLTNPVLSFITPKMGEQLLSIVREALSNSSRHARASHRWVRLRLADNAIHLIIGDNGIGFSTRRRRRAGHGLDNMAARAKQISATFTLESAPGKGTHVFIDVPLKGNAYE